MLRHQPAGSKKVIPFKVMLLQKLKSNGIALVLAFASRSKIEPSIIPPPTTLTLVELYETILALTTAP